MSQVLIEESTLTNIANAIRNKNGTSGLMYPEEMGGAIDSIETISDKTMVNIFLDSSGYQNGYAIFKDQYKLFTSNDTSWNISMAVGESITFVNYVQVGNNKPDTTYYNINCFSKTRVSNESKPFVLTLIKNSTSSLNVYVSF